MKFIQCNVHVNSRSEVMTRVKMMNSLLGVERRKERLQKLLLPQKKVIKAVYV